MTDRSQKFQVGDVVRVADPRGFIATFARKVADRDAVVRSLVLDWHRLPTINSRTYQGRVLVEFQKRNGRGKVFTEILHERHLVFKEAQ